MSQSSVPDVKPENGILEYMEKHLEQQSMNLKLALENVREIRSIVNFLDYEVGRLKNPKSDLAKVPAARR